MMFSDVHCSLLTLGRILKREAPLKEHCVGLQTLEPAGLLNVGAIGSDGLRLIIIMTSGLRVSVTLDGACRGTEFGLKCVEPQF